MLMLLWGDLAADDSTFFPVGADADADMRRCWCWCEEILLQIIPLSSQHVLLKTSGRESSRRFVPNQLLCQARPLEADSVFSLCFFYFQLNAKMVKIGTTSGRAVGIAQIWPKNSPLGSQTLTWKVTSGYGVDHSSYKEEDDLILAEDLFRAQCGLGSSSRSLQRRKLT